MSTPAASITYNSLYQTRYIGSKQDDNPYIQGFFSQYTINMISKKVTSMLKGVDKKGREIIVPDKHIFDFMNTIYDSYSAPIGFDQNRTKEEYIDNLVGQCIARIVYEVDTTLSIEQAFADYSAWNTVYGDFNEVGLRQHAPIKVRNNKPATMQFNMKY